MPLFDPQLSPASTESLNSSPSSPQNTPFPPPSSPVPVSSTSDSTQNPPSPVPASPPAPKSVNSCSSPPMHPSPHSPSSQTDPPSSSSPPPLFLLLLRFFCSILAFLFSCWPLLRSAILLLCLSSMLFNIVLCFLHQNLVKFRFKKSFLDNSEFL